MSSVFINGTGSGPEHRVTILGGLFPLNFLCRSACLYLNCLLANVYTYLYKMLMFILLELCIGPGDDYFTIPRRNYSSPDSINPICGDVYIDGQAGNDLSDIYLSGAKVCTPRFYSPTISVCVYSLVLLY